jgi:hypothetical protein
MSAVTLNHSAYFEEWDTFRPWWQEQLQAGQGRESCSILFEKLQQVLHLAGEAGEEERN